MNQFKDKMEQKPKQVDNLYACPTFVLSKQTYIVNVYHLFYFKIKPFTALHTVKTVDRDQQSDMLWANAF